MSVIEWSQALKAPSLRLLGVFLLVLMVALTWRMGWLEPGRASKLALSVDALRETPSSAGSTFASPIRSFGVGPDATTTHLKSAIRDPFSAQAAPLPAPTVPVVAAPALAAPITPREPVPSLSFAGRMQTPDGRTVVLARWADGTPVSLEEGKDLGNGYRVERMTEQSVDLLNPQTQAMVQLALPPAPPFEIR
jgi:hypothetical protein